MGIVDIRRALKYPPEVFAGTIEMDLNAGLNDLFSYTGLNIDKLYATLVGFSSVIAKDVQLRVSVDNKLDYMVLHDLGAIMGLDYLYETKISCTSSMIARARALSAYSGFAMRYHIKVQRLGIVHKILHGIALTDREKRVAEELDLESIVKSYPVEPWTPYKGITTVMYESTFVSSTGTFFRVTPPANTKVVLLGIAVERPSSTNKFRISVTRDGVDDIMVLDAYALPSINAFYGAPNNYAWRVVALDELIIEADVVSGGPYKVRIIYGYGPLTIAEKIAWGRDLTPKEREIAEKLKLFEQVEAGLLP